MVYLIHVSKANSHSSAANRELEIDVASVICSRIALDSEMHFRAEQITLLSAQQTARTHDRLALGALVLS
jgi:hypothetical protein